MLNKRTVALTKPSVLFSLSVVASLVLVITARGSTLPPQTGSSERQRAFHLWEKSNFAESIPILEKLSTEGPEIAVLSRLGFALYATSITIKDPEARLKQLDRAREILIQSRQLGDDSNLTQITLDALSSKDPAGIPLSAIKDAEEAIREGEAAFVHGDLDKALAAYERALKIDPKLYAAAVYAGDMYFKKGYGATHPETKTELLNKAGGWFARAIQIDPDQETAYRYWGDALVLQKKWAEARNKFVDAIVAEPYGSKAYVGLQQWANQVKAKLAHPDIKQPSPSIGATEKSDRKTIIMDPTALDANEGPAFYWSLYDLVRASYKTIGFAKDHPGEDYRHTLREEASALQVVAETASRHLKEGKLTKTDTSLTNLIKLSNAGLIEPYVLFARADEGIAQDYSTYRKANRDKLRQYWLDFVIEESK